MRDSITNSIYVVGEQPPKKPEEPLRAPSYWILLLGLLGLAVCSTIFYFPRGGKAS